MKLNQVAKRILTRSIFVLFSSINKVLPHDSNRILLYSNLGFRDNTKALYDFLIEEEYFLKYKIVCCTNDYKQFKSSQNLPNVLFKSNILGILEYFRCSYVYYSFGKIPICPHKSQKVIQMWHGTPLKAPGDTMLQSASDKGKFYTHIFAASEMFKPVMCDWFRCPVNLIYVNGHPRTDVFYKGMIKHYDLGEYDKLVLWAPTFRSSTKLGYADVDKSSLIPIIDYSEFNNVEAYLKEKNVKVIVKLHPLQDASMYQLEKFSNFILMTHEEFSKREMDLYRLAAQADSLITDYSSIFFDYLLLNRPIAFTEDDIQSYGDKRGFSVDPEKFRPGFRIKDLTGFYNFIDFLAQNKDDYKTNREEINVLVNRYQDGRNSMRALDLADIKK